MTPVKRLVLAVFRQAVADFKKRNAVLNMHASSHARGTTRDRKTAIDFLCADVGEWAEARAAWAGLVGLRTERLHRWAKHEQEGDQRATQ